MEKAGAGHTVVSLGWCRRVLFAALISCVVAFAGTQAFAAITPYEPHFPDSGDIDNPDPEGNCYNCHTLDTAEGVSSTDYIQGSARTMQAMLSRSWPGKAAGQAPDKLGCTFCHYSITSTARMQEVLTHFGSKLSMHPLGKKISDGSDTDGEYFSTVDTAQADAIDCVDCHDAALLAPNIAEAPDFFYAGHISKTHANRVNNPYMLRQAGGTVTGTEFDDLCRDCHGSGKAYPVTSHADATTGNPIVEDDSTRMATTPATNPQNDKTQCTKCHDSHYSTKVKLFNDGKDGETAIDGNDCTAVCHYPGDENNGYTLHGHKKGASTYKYKLGVVNFTAGNYVGLTMPCTGCHASLNISNPPTAGNAHVRGPADIAGNAANYMQRFNLDKQSFDADALTSIYGNPLRGICTYCHSTYEEHVVAATGGTADVGCQDCHDEHAEGSGTGSNAFMIPQTSKKSGVFNTAVTGFRVKAGTEVVSYDTGKTRWDGAAGVLRTTGIDFFNATNTGFCDNSECHTKWGTNLNDLMVTGGTYNHTGPQPQLAGADCEGCHQHSGDSYGGWRANDSCDTCHQTNGLVHTDSNESAAVHTTTHRAGLFITNCADCHSHRGEITYGTAPHGNGTINFKPAASGGKLDSTLDYAVGAAPAATTSCATNACHDADPGDWKAGNLGADECEDCHDSGTKGVKDESLDQGWWTTNANGSAKHDEHIGTGALYIPTDCDSCHGTDASTGAHTGHRNGTIQNTVTYVSGTQTCTITCHAVGNADWTAGGTLTCTECHGGTYIGGGANMPTSGLHVGTPTITARTHDDSFAYNGGGSTATCDTCHTTTPSDNHVDGTKDLSDPIVNFAANVGFVDGTPPTCAPSLTGCHSDQAAGVGAWSRKWHANAGATDGNECAGCHGGTPLDATPTTWTAWNAGVGTLDRPNLVPHGGLAAASIAHDGDWNSDGSSGEISPNHDVCKYCHGMNSPTDKNANYVINANNMWDPTGVNSYHGNGKIEVNGPSAASNLANNATPIGSEYNANDDATLEPSDYGCTKACHQGAANTNHNMGESAWTFQYKDFGAGSCNLCHGYPPLNGTGGAGNYADRKPEDYTDGGAGHDAADHLSPTILATDGWTPCLKCHPSGTHGEGGSTVSRANVQVTIAGTYDDKAAAAAAYFKHATNPSGSYCTNVSCHGGVQTPVWTGTITVSTQCTQCHIKENVADRASATQWNSAITGLHAVTTSISKKDHWADANATCGGASSCHQGVPTNHFGANLDSTAMVELTQATAGMRAGVTISSGPHDPNTDTCQFACHSDNNTWARLNDRAKAIATDGSECQTCHGGAPMDATPTTWTAWRTGAGLLDRPAGVGPGQLLNGAHDADWNNDGVSGEISPSSAHSGCKVCHGMNTAGDADTDYIIGTMWNPSGTASDHGDGNINMNGPSAQSNLANNATAVGAEYNGNDDGSTEASDFACTAACHSGANNTNHNMGDSTTWALEYKDFGKGSCNGCHNSETNPGGYWPEGGTAGPDRGGRHQVHMQALATRLTITLPGTDAEQRQMCEYCHAAVTNDGDHSQTYPADVFISSDATRFAKNMANAADGDAAYSGASTGSLAGQTGTGACATVDCHGNKTTATNYRWYDATASACMMCHDLGGTNSTTVANPASGLHNLNQTNTTAHDDAFPNSGVCTSCHTKASIGGHFDGSASGATPNYTAAQVGFNSTAASYTDNGTTGATRGTCSGTSTALSSCHSDGGNWTRLWSTDANVNHVASPSPGAAVCNVCHGQYSSLNANGWNAGTSHYRAGDGATEDKGAAHLNGVLANSCEDCHGYSSVAVHNSNDMIDFSDGGTTTYTATYAAAPARWYCASCHNGDSAQDPTLTGTHTFPDSLAFVNAKNSVDGAIEPTCVASASCHGAGLSGEGNANYWPDQADVNGWAKRDGAHTTHVQAIYNANSGTLSGATPTAKKNNTCNWCHPGGAHSGDQAAAPADLMDGSSTFFKTMAGGTDSNATFSATTHQCSNIDCHAGAITPQWFPDTTAPSFATSFTATDAGTGGTVSLSWGAANDATTPITYDVYWSSVSAGDVFNNSPGITGLAATTVDVAGLTNGTPYWFGVRAYDGALPANFTNNATTPTATPTTPWGAPSNIYYLARNSGSLLYTGVSTNLPACGSATTNLNLAAQSILPPLGRGLLSIGSWTCAASTLNYIQASTVQYANVSRYFSGFYANTTYAQAKRYTGRATGNQLLLRGSTTADRVAIYLASYNNSTQASVTSAKTFNVGSAVTGSVLSPDLSSLSINVPSGQKLAMILSWIDSGGTSNGTYSRIFHDAVNTIRPQIDLDITPGWTDTTPPTWAATNLNVQDLGISGALQVTWNASATDATTPPVLYNLYRASASSAVYTSPYRTALTVSNFRDSGLTNGDTYYYGIRAMDSMTPPNETTNTDIKQGIPTGPGWLDVAPPVWSPDSGISGTDTTEGGTILVSWNAATDASTPIYYDVYWSDVLANVFSSPVGTLPGQTGLSATIGGLTNGTTYYFGVRAHDSQAPTANYTTNTDTSVGVAPSRMGSPANTFYLTKSAATLLYTGVSTNLPACGTGLSNVALGAASVLPPVGRGMLRIGSWTCAASTNNMISAATTNMYANVSRYFGGFYHNTTYATGKQYTGKATGSQLFLRGSSSADRVAIYLAAYNAATQVSVTSAKTFNVGTAASGSLLAPDLSGLSLAVPTGQKLAMILSWIDSGGTSNSTAANRIFVDAVNSTSQPHVDFEVADVDASAPTWSGGVNGITVTKPNIDHTLNISWNSATDTTAPVLYTLYRSSNSTNVYLSMLKDNLGTTTFQDSSLTNGVTYYYGVNAKDGWSPSNITNESTIDSGTPTAASQPCNFCHGIPPVSGGGAGSHAAHSGSGGDLTVCNKCHPGASSYTNGHQDGRGQLAFPGMTVANAVYSSSSLSYTYNGSFIYRDNNGYGTLTGSTGDGVDTGTCYNTGNNGTGCHGTTAAPVWGGTVACGSCHGTVSSRVGASYQDPSTDINGAPPTDRAGASTGARVGKHLNHLNASYVLTGTSCDLCHLGAGSSGKASHADGTASGGGTNADVAFHAAAGASASFSGGSCSNLGSSCHSAQVWNSTTTIAGGCTGCHNAGDYTTHTKLASNGVAVGCEQCHPGGTAFTSKHGSTDPRVVTIPNNAQVGISYFSGGIHLGGDATAAYTATSPFPGSKGLRATFTEAELCWACHDANSDGDLLDTGLTPRDISEWGTNTESNGTEPNYDFGSLTGTSTISAPVRSWFNGTWVSGNFSYKTGKLTSKPTTPAGTPGSVANLGSIHTANPAGAPWNGPTGSSDASNIDTVAQVRCSYCHDVHQLNKAPNDPGTAGAPFLRGTWMGSPYREDGAPRSGNTWTAVGSLGSVPRGGTATTALGGYQIDQNNGGKLNATTWAANNAAGLCALCHGTSPNGSWTAGEIDELNQFPTTPEWASGMTNGHSAAVLGGSSSNAFNLLSEGRRHVQSATYATAGGQGSGAFSAAPWMGLKQLATGSQGRSFRGLSGYGYSPDAGDNTYAHATWDWGATVDYTTLDSNFHQFPCAKCHTPHASRLPRLLITNCLDTKVNNWDDGYQSATEATLSSENMNTTISQWTSARNCHRRRDPGYGKTWSPAGGAGDAGGDGWNDVTPW